MSYGDYLRNKYHHAAVKIADAEGVPCVLEYSKGKNIRNYEIYGNSMQDGTPSVDSPVEIQSVGDLVTDTESAYYGKYDLPITVTGKNLLKYPYYWTSRVRSGIMFTVNEDGTIMLSGTTTLSGTAIDDFTLAYETKIESGTYTVSGCPEGGSSRKYRIFLHIKDSSGNSRYISDIGNGATFTVTATSTMTVSIRIGAEIGTVNNLVFAPQIELGSTATEYEPYKGETKHIYLDEPLRKVENYADYIDFKNQKVVRNVEVLDDTGTKTISESFGTLATPTEKSISASALKTFKGTSIISADTTVLPSNIKAKYVRT